MSGSSVSRAPAHRLNQLLARVVCSRDQQRDLIGKEDLAAERQITIYCGETGDAVSVGAAALGAIRAMASWAFCMARVTSAISCFRSVSAV